MHSKRISLLGKTFQLYPDKVMFWEERSLLIVSDVHLGKATHFRKNGIAVPGNVHQKDIKRLTHLISITNPNEIIFLGDLFHSELNAEWGIFKDWLQNYPNIKFSLVIGNHDIIHESTYEDAGLGLYQDYEVGQFLFTHKEKKTSFYNISGHIHPSIRLNGPAKQSMRLPCFYFKPTKAYMPAFGGFTGTYTLHKSPRDIVFGICNGELIKF